MKKCGKCKADKDDDDFSPSHLKKSGGWCRQCNTEYMREFKSKNKERLQEYQQKYDAQYYQDNKMEILRSKQNYYVENKNKILKDRKQYYLDNKKNIRTYNKSYYRDNREQLLESSKEYATNHREDINKYHSIYYKQKRIDDPSFRIRSTISANINYYLKVNRSSKNNKSCLDFLPFTIIELKEHLEKQFESWMFWINYGKYNSKTWDDNDSSTWTWQIDHIIPQSKLPYTSMEDANFKKCWALENLRPLSAKQNFLDGVNRTRHT